MVTEPQLNKRLSDILEFIKAQVRLKGYPPSVREIGEAVGLKSTSTVHAYLNRLEEYGYIRRNPATPRAIELMDSARDSGEETVDIPIIGRVAAGVPITAVENWEGQMPVPARFVHGGPHFMLEVKGDSMIEAGILPGDLLLVREQAEAANGDIVIAIVEDEATVKRYYRREDHVELVPENSSMKPLIYDNVTVVGKVAGLFRIIR